METGETMYSESSAEARQTLPRYQRAVGAGQRQAPAMLLTSRDLALLDDVWRFRFLTTSQIETLRAGDPEEEFRFVSRLTLTRRLKLLFHHRYLRRIARPLAGNGARCAVLPRATQGARFRRYRFSSFAFSSLPPLQNGARLSV